MYKQGHKLSVMTKSEITRVNGGSKPKNQDQIKSNHNTFLPSFPAVANLSLPPVMSAACW